MRGKLLAFFLLFSTVIGKSQQYEDADDAFAVCGNQSVAFDQISGTGNNPDNFNSLSGCRLSQMQTIWLRFKVFTGGTLAFEIVPNNPSNDYDFGVFGPNPDVNNLPSPIRSSFAAATGNTGLRLVSVFTEACEDDDGDKFVDHIDVLAGEEYLILVDNFAVTGTPFSLAWSGTATLDCSIVVGDLGPDQQVCAGTEVILDGTSSSDGVVTYQWAVDDTPYDGIANFVDIVGATNPTLTINDDISAIYQVTVTAGGTPSVDEVLVEFFEPPVLIPDVIFEVCSSNPSYDFDLSEINSLITNETNIKISYHEQNSDSAPEITSPYNSTSKEIWARVENNGGCVSWIDLDLLVTIIPVVTTFDLQECQPDGSGQIGFDLDQYLTDMRTAYPDLDFEIFSSRANADAGAPVQTGIYTNTSNPQTLYIKATDPSSPNCPAINTFQLIVENPPASNQPSDFELCDDDSDGFAMFDLSTKNSEILVNSGNTITYHTSAADAISGNAPLPTTYTNTANNEVIYVRVDDGNGCISSNPISFQLIVNPLPVMVSGLELEGCSDVSTYDFDLTSLNSSVTTSSNVTVTYHANQADAISGNAPLPATYNTNSGTIWARAEDNNTGCFETTSVTLIVYVYPTLTVTNLQECQPDGSGQIAFDLDAYLNSLRTANPNLVLSIHLTQALADSGNNPLTGSFTNTSNPQSLYVRAEESSVPQCPKVESFQLIVDEPAETNQPTDFELCDDDTDGFAVFNLSTKDSEILVNSGNTVTYHISAADAISGNAPLPTNYRNTSNNETIYARVDGGNGCFSNNPLSFDLIVNPLPVMISGASLTSCSQTSVGSFNLQDLNNQVTSEPNVTITYHTTNAEPTTNNPALPNAYQSSGETIWARAENNSTGCVNWVSAALKIDLAPNTSITSITICEDVTGSGVGTFAMDDVISQISADSGHDVEIYENSNFTNRITGTYSSTSKTVYLLIGATTNSSCPGERELSLVVNPNPEEEQYKVENCLIIDNPYEFYFDTKTLNSNYQYQIFENIDGTGSVQFPYTTAQDSTRLYVFNLNPTTGCNSISTLDLLVVDFTENILDTIDVCYKDSYILPDGREVWDDGTFIILDEENCIKNVYNVDFYGCYCTPDLPNAFAPNSNLSNEIFKGLEPYGCSVTVKSLRIYNRWGEKIFETQGDKGWDGQFDGQNAQQGTFLWYVEFDYVTDRGEEGSGNTSGTVFLLR